MKENIKIPVVKEINIAHLDTDVTPNVDTSNYVEFINRRYKTESDHYWYAITPKGKRFSVVDVKSLFKSHDMQSMRDYFDYWEAMPLDESGRVEEPVIRCKSMEELAHQIIKI